MLEQKTCPIRRLRCRPTLPFSVCRLLCEPIMAGLPAAVGFVDAGRATNGKSGICDGMAYGKDSRLTRKFAAFGQLESAMSRYLGQQQPRRNLDLLSSRA